ncbi:uncharacterized protein LOC114405092 [Glycine soja]|uniref:uncharacterized protein LOC114405092 n=1 Tax=Glycine soja TaxID=3848 RepID=UPI00103A291E|nr:uncharacterized protein LOC114405092 [Glycine soja]
MIQMMLPSGEGLQHRHRQWETAPVAEDDHVVATNELVVPTDEPVVAGDVQALGADAADDTEGFPSGPHDPSVLRSMLTMLLSAYGTKRPAPEIEGLVAVTGLSPLIACSVDTGDRGLISSFVERWHRETSSFHLPVREVSITLDDVASLLHLPIVGAFHTFQPLHVDEAVLMLVELLEVSGEAARAETTHCHGPYCWIYEHFLLVAECIIDPDYDEVSPRACWWIAMKVTVKTISTVTYRKRLD